MATIELAHNGWALTLDDYALQHDGGRVQLVELVRGVGDHKQHWLYDPDSGAIYCRIHPERVLSCPDHANLTHLTMMPRGAARDQAWNVEPNGAISLRSNPNKLLSSESNGRQVWIHDRIGNQDQIWRFTYKGLLKPRRFPNSCVSACDKFENGSPVQMFDPQGHFGNHNQFWHLEIGSGHLYLRDHPQRVLSGKCEQRQELEPAHLWERVGQSNHNQAWVLHPETGALYLRAHPQMLYSLESGGAKNGGRVWFYKNVGPNENQQWYFDAPMHF